MNLVLVRHAEAADNPERSLSVEGIRQAGQTAEWAAKKGLRVGQILHSGKQRAKQTAEIIGKRIVPENGIAAVSGLRPDDNVRSALADLEAEGLPSVMLVGHNPFMGLFAHQLLSNKPDAPSLTFHHGTIACFVKDSSGWTLEDTFTP